MDEYVSKKALLKAVEKMDRLDKESTPYEYNKEGYILLIESAPTADVAEVKHGKWHILPDDPYDESGVPAEEGWYRIITADGQETTDYFFNKPTMCEHGITYWKNARSTIRAWAKMDGGKEELKKITRADLRGKPLDKDCHKAYRSTHEYGIEDNRVYCLGLIDCMNDELLEKCRECNAHVTNVTPLRKQNDFKE